MTLDPEVRRFVPDNHRAVLSTFRRNGAAQLSIVTCGAYGDGVAFSTTEGRAKLGNLKRDPRCSLLVSRDDWWGYVVLEGRADVLSADRTPADELARALREVSRAASGREHPHWDEYDEAMRAQRRAAVVVIPEHIYSAGI